jgi:hypothetical protein
MEEKAVRSHGLLWSVKKGLGATVCVHVVIARFHQGNNDGVHHAVENLDGVVRSERRHRSRTSIGLATCAFFYLGLGYAYFSINDWETRPYLGSHALKISRAEGKRKEVVEVPFFDANPDVVIVESLQAQPIKVRRKGTCPFVQGTPNPKDTCVEGDTQKEAVELTTEKDVIRIHDSTETWIGTREGDETLRGHLMREFVHAVISEIVQDTIRRKAEEWCRYGVGWFVAS